MTLPAQLLLAGLALVLPAAATAHVSERALVMLLPTGVWVPAGAAAVALTALILAFAPPAAPRAAARRPAQPLFGPGRGALAASLASAALLLALAALGRFGPRDPLANLLPLTVWTLFFVGLPLLQLLCGDLWRHINPWTGLHRLLAGDGPPPLALPAWLGRWPAVVSWMAVSGFLLADPAPSDPGRLAAAVLIYWAAALAGTLLFGRVFLDRAEGFTCWLRLFSACAPLSRGSGRPVLRAPGSRLATAAAPGAGGAVFVLAALGAGSFDGLNETFWWLARIGVNPLEFPGRSAVIGETLGGMAASVVGLTAVFAACVAAGLALGGAPMSRFPEAFGRFALTLAPIVAGYHAAHYLLVLMINGQYALGALNDPLASGADLLGLSPFYVTTSFVNQYASVRAIWLTQAGAIVLGHAAGVHAAHLVALDLFGGSRRAALSQIPLAGFMVLYTLFGLWLLASPTGA